MTTTGPRGQKPYRKLGELLVAAGVIDELQLQSALGHQKQWGGRIGHILLDLHFIDDLTLARTLAEQLDLQMISLRTAPLDLGVVRFLPQNVAERLLVFPVSFAPDAQGAGVLTVAFSDPTNLAGIDEVRFETGKVVRPAVATESEVAWAIRRFYYGEEDTEPLTPPAEPAPPPDREGLFGDGNQLLSESEEDSEEDLAELEPIPSDSQIDAPPFVASRTPTLPDFATPAPNPEPRPEVLTTTRPGPAVAAELDAAFERTFAIDGSESPAAFSPQDIPSLAEEARAAGLSGHALQALIRILVRKGLVSEIEILDELQSASPTSPGLPGSPGSDVEPIGPVDRPRR
jgi:type IV pilus assembly protein PilB